VDRPVRVLSIDGGGIRGLIPAIVLAELEQRAQAPACELFDLVAGTSTGGIIALALTCPGADGRPAWRAEDLVSLYRDEGPKIFSRSPWQRVRTLLGALHARYSPTGLETALSRYFGDARLKHALVPVIVTAYDLERRKPFFFKSERAKKEPARDFPMRLAARATSGAPTYFSPPLLTNEASGKTYALVDGGVYANNPSMCAVAEVLSEHPAEVVMVSLGTGQLTRPILHRHAKDWGLFRWARPILDVVLDGVSDTVDYELEQLIGARRHRRLQVELEHASDRLDRTDAANLKLLDQEARRLIETHDGELDEIVAQLKDPRPV
jgi:predicted acylesterase/phospholipase RssA